MDFYSCAGSILPFPADLTENHEFRPDPGRNGDFVGLGAKSRFLPVRKVDPNLRQTRPEMVFYCCAASILQFSADQTENHEFRPDPGRNGDFVGLGEK